MATYHLIIIFVFTTDGMLDEMFHIWSAKAGGLEMKAQNLGRLSNRHVRLTKKRATTRYDVLSITAN